MNLVLIGYRGTGKTTVARRLGLLLGWPWADADEEVELRAGQSIAAIFGELGEQAFRDLEAAVLADFVARDETVIALGGGAVLRPQNRDVIRRLGFVVWLQADSGSIWERITQDATTPDRRPNLTRHGGLAEIEELLAVRRSLYAECAQCAIDTEGKSPAEIATEVLERMKSTREAPKPA